MTVQFSLPNATPTQAEVDAAIQRAHRERAEAFRRILGNLLWRSKTASAGPEQASGLGTAACG